MHRLLKPRAIFAFAIVGMLGGCGSAPSVVTPDYPSPGVVTTLPSGAPPALPPATAPLLQERSRWTPVEWSELPGLGADAIGEAWVAWLRSCEKPDTALAPLCGDVRRLQSGTDDERRSWMLARLQPYRVESLQNQPVGLLTGYYVPVAEASRLPNEQFRVPLYQPPAGLYRRKPWFSRQEMDTLPEAKAELKGREIAWLADPVEALKIQIQGSGRLLITEPDGRKHMVRVGYAGTNGQPYRSVGRWLRDQGALRDTSWPSIARWIQQNPGRVQELLWANPRVTFFREQALPDDQHHIGPEGGQGVPLTPGRSIAVDPKSIPYGTPVWLDSAGPQVQLRKLVLAQDTGSAIIGAVRADYFVGTGEAAADLAGRLRQPLRLWVLWPRGAAR